MRITRMTLELEFEDTHVGSRSHGASMPALAARRSVAEEMLSWALEGTDENPNPQADAGGAAAAAAAAPGRARPPQLCLHRSYDMSKRRLAVVFNHFEFQEDGHEDRHGTDADVANIIDTFGEIRFQINVYEDKPYSDIESIVDGLCDTIRQNQSDISCLFAFILTHGNEGDMVATFDRLYDAEKVILEKMAQVLPNKPKVLVVQACRCVEVDEGHEHSEGPMETVVADAKPLSGPGAQRMVIPTGADCLVIKACIERRRSYRCEKMGTLLIRELCKQVCTSGPLLTTI